jgi:hypothetical protein
MVSWNNPIQEVEMKDDSVRDQIIEVLIKATEGQLRALRRLRKEQPSTVKKRRSNIDLIEDILLRAQQPLHVNAIIEQVQRAYGVALDRESIVSALTKKVHRHERFRRTAPNTFGLLEEGGE